MTQQLAKRRIILDMVNRELYMTYMTDGGWKRALRQKTDKARMVFIDKWVSERDMLLRSLGDLTDDDIQTIPAANPDGHIFLTTQTL